MAYDMKEIFGEVFTGYINIKCNPQSQYRKESVEKLFEALARLETMGTSFDELAADRAYQELIMVTDTGFERFKNFVHEFIRYGYDDRSDMSDIVDEQLAIAKWVKEHRKELVS